MPSPVDRIRHETVEGEWSLEEACDRFIAAHVGAWTAKTETKNRASLGMFKQFAGVAGTPLTSIDRRVIGDFKALIEKLPTTHGKRAADRDRSLQSIVEEAERAGAERLAPTTIQGHLSALNGLFRYAKEHGRYTADNPASGSAFRGRDGRGTSDPRGHPRSLRHC